jgi:hypothetical protein
MSPKNPLGRKVESVFSRCPMGNSKGRDNVRKRAIRRKKSDRIILAKARAKKPA